MHDLTEIFLWRCCWGLFCLLGLHRFLSFRFAVEKIEYVYLCCWSAATKWDSNSPHGNLWFWREAGSQHIAPISHVPWRYKPFSFSSFCTLQSSDPPVRTSESFLCPDSAALGDFKSHLTEYEQAEISDYKQVWYLGQKADKTVYSDFSNPEDVRSYNNFGYDTAHGFYRIVSDRNNNKTGSTDYLKIFTAAYFTVK